LSLPVFYLLLDTEPDSAEKVVNTPHAKAVAAFLSSGYGLIIGQASELADTREQAHELHNTLSPSLLRFNLLRIPWEQRETFVC
jgi:hypothetical protein